ncbi:MAG: hypothetical protein J3Q66DRAFT_336179, partial [Benniella sp.]
MPATPPHLSLTLSPFFFFFLFLSVLTHSVSTLLLSVCQPRCHIQPTSLQPTHPIRAISCSYLFSGRDLPHCQIYYYTHPPRQVRIHSTRFLHTCLSV